MIYKLEHIKECKDYLNYSVKHGFMDEDMAQEMIDKKDWKAIYDLIDQGDFLANQKEGDNK